MKDRKCAVMAPQADHKQYTDQRSDMYSIAGLVRGLAEPDQVSINSVHHNVAATAAALAASICRA